MVEEVVRAMILKEYSCAGSNRASIHGFDSTRPGTREPMRHRSRGVGGTRRQRWKRKYLLDESPPLGQWASGEVDTSPPGSFHWVLESVRRQQFRPRRSQCPTGPNRTASCVLRRGDPHRVGPTGIRSSIMMINTIQHTTLSFAAKCGLTGSSNW